MIKRFIRRVLGLSSETTLRVPREKHGLARERLSPAAAKVCSVLRDAGFTGRVAGLPSFRDGKVRRLDDWLAGLGRRFADFGESACYSDSHNDLPLLERVSRPVAVDPDETLAREAARRGWERISLR